MKNRVELFCHTKMSKLQGINSAKEYIEEAIKRGYKFIAITDVDSTQAFFEAYEYLKSNIDNQDFKVIYGAEMHFKNEKIEHNIYTIYIYVKEQRGLKSLYKLISKAYKNIINGIPIIYKKDLEEYRDGLLFASIGDKGEIYQRLDSYMIDDVINFYDFIGIVAETFDKNRIIKINELCKKYNKTLIGTSECDFINKDDYKCNEMLNFYKKSTNIEYGNSKYFQTADELLNSFNYIENAKEIVIDNPKKIAEKIEKIDLIPHKIENLKIDLADRIIAKKCYDKAKEIYGNQLSKEVKDRLELELQSIRKNNFDSIYLLSSELVKYSNELGYKVGSRGSVGNSFVAFLLGITEINPLKYNLPFEFFAGKDYDKEPDIDLNFSGKITDKIFVYLQRKYGKDRIIWGGTELYKYDILGYDYLTMLYELEKKTNVDSNTIKLDDKETLKMFLHANDKSYSISTIGVPEFGTTFVKQMIEISKPRNFNDLICISALLHGTGTWTYNASSLIEKEHKKVDEVISNRADMFNYLIKHGIEKSTAFDIVEFVRKGNASRIQNLFKNNMDRYKILNEKWNKYKKILQEYNIPEWYIKSAEKIKYMFPKSHTIGYTINAFKIAWYKVHYPKEFYKVYFKIKSDLDINDYYCKRTVMTELNRLYDLKEIHDNNIEFDYDYINDDKIKDLELILEMFNRGILKEKVEIKDDYNLINSRAIADYCRSIKHKFNTEELAVLVYRNQRMSLEEKIDKYNDLIKNYHDMEVIERINCKHYSSVKTMIKDEIQRIKILNKKLIQDDENCIYTWTEFNKSTQKYEHSGDIEHTFKTYKEAFKNIMEYIKEYDDTISFRITKKYFDKQKEKIFADYNVENKKAILVDISENNKIFLDINQIFLNIPTPFKKGDILISNNSTMCSYGESNDIFVLEYLCTWRKNLARYLADGNYDSSDMIGYGYFFINGDTTEFVRDHKWDYDSFEYYDGELTGRDRILKDISSFVKGKIELELFIHAYDVYKTEFKNNMPNFYTDEGLKLAGMTDIDIEKTNHVTSGKIYNMPKNEQEKIFELFTCIYNKLNKNEIKQIETDFDNNIYVLTNNGKLYKTSQYDVDLEYICMNILKIFYLDGRNLYKITSENIILPIDNNKVWDNTDKYLNNNNCKYKKIETSKMHIVVLTEDGCVRALCGGYPCLGIIPDNFINVNDITIVEDEYGTDKPYIYKNNEFVELYIG